MAEENKDGRIEFLDREELLDLVQELKEEILKRIKKLSMDWSMIHELQQKRERAENRLAELGFREKK
jgi:hypothetical protein